MGYCEFPHPASISPPVCARECVCVCLRVFPLHVQNRNNMEEISWTHSREETGGLQSLKISRAADRSAGLDRGNSASIPSISAIPAAFSTISKVLPYKLKTTEAVPDKMEKEKSSRLPRGSCFPSTRDVSAEASGRFLFFFPRRLDEEVLGIPRLPCCCVAATERGDRP